MYNTYLTLKQVHKIPEWEPRINFSFLFVKVISSHHIYKTSMLASSFCTKGAKKKPNK